MCTEIYNEKYAEEYRKREQSELGKQIYAARWEFVERHCSGKMTLLDYGCANGAFHLTSRNGFDAGGYDVNPFSPFNKQPAGRYDILTFWDSLEHLPDLILPLIYHDPLWIFISTPNLESVVGPVKDWKHYKPYEHVHYFDKYSLEFIFGDAGYDIKEINFEEGALRDPKNPEAIISVALKKR